MTARGYSQTFREHGQYVRSAPETGYLIWDVRFAAGNVCLGSDNSRSRPCRRKTGNDSGRTKIAIIIAA